MESAELNGVTEKHCEYADKYFTLAEKLTISVTRYTPYFEMIADFCVAS